MSSQTPYEIAKVPRKGIGSDSLDDVVNIVHPGAKRPRGPLHKLVSEICDIDEPPFAKSFLRVDVGPDALQIVCSQVTGVAGEVVSTSKVPTMEDEACAMSSRRIPESWDCQPSGPA